MFITFFCWFCLWITSCAWTVAQSCWTLCGHMDCSPPGSSVHGIFQARILEWVAVPTSRGSSQPRDQTHISCIGRQILYHWTTWEALMYTCLGVCMLSCFSHVWLFTTLWTVAHQAPLFSGFSQQECWSGSPFLPPGDLPNPGIKPTSPTIPALAGGSIPLAPPRKP